MFVVAQQEPVGVVPLSEALTVAIGFAVIFGGMGWLGLAIRSGRAVIFRRAAAALEQRTGVAGWAILPAAIMMLALVLGAAGMMWDVNTHLESGRDEGLVAQPSHILALIGLVSATFGAWLSLVLPQGRPSRASVRLSRSWWVPVSGLVAFLSMSMTIISFPLDDLWHRLFGLDVALWSPIHFVLMGAAFSGAVAGAYLVFEGALAVRGEFTPAARRLSFFLLGFLVSFPPVMVDEWSLGVPQAAPAYEVVTLCLSLTGFIALQAAFGRQAAVRGWFVYVALAAVLMGYVALVAETVPRMPLMLGFALGVQAAAWWLGTDRVWRFSVVAGLLGAGLGVVGEMWWSEAFRFLAWQPSMLVSHFELIVLAGVSFGLLGGFIGRMVMQDAPLAVKASTSRVGAVGVAGAIVALTVVAGAEGGGGTASLTTTLNAEATAVTSVAVRFTPAEIAEDADWLYVASYQGGGLRFEDLSQGADGVWRAEGNWPVTGTWKTVIRLAKDGRRSAVPVRMPADEPLGLAEIPALTQDTRDVVDDLLMMQRERRTDVPGFLWGAALGVCLALWGILLGAHAWALLRLGRSATARPGHGRLETNPGALAPKQGAPR